MSVKLVSKTVGVGKYQNLNPDEIIASIARHGTIKEDNGKLVKYLINHAHWSPLEHVHYTFYIETSRGISAQIMRHWTLHAQESSQRYSESNKINPIEFRLEHKTNRQSSTRAVGWVNEDFSVSFNDCTPQQKKAILKASNALENTNKVYEELIDSGIAKETARSILPMNSKTYLHMTGNLRDWLSFLNVRCDDHAQKEIRYIATAIGEELEKHHPKSFENLDWKNGMFMFTKN